MPTQSMTDDAEAQLVNSGKQKVSELSVDAASDIASYVANKQRSIDFSQFNVQVPEYKAYFQEGERRQVYGEVAYNFHNGNPDAPVYGFSEEETPVELPDDIYERYDHQVEKSRKKIERIEKKQSKNRERLVHDTEKSNNDFRKIPRKKSRLLTYSKEKGRLIHKDKGRMTEREYYKRLHHKDVAERKHERLKKKTAERTKRLLDDENIAEDELAGETGKRLKHARQTGKRIIHQDVKRLRHSFNHYARLQHSHAKVEARLAKEQRLEHRKNWYADDALKRSAESAKMKAKLKKEITMRRAREQGNLTMRLQNFVFIKRKVGKARRLAFKRNLALISSVSSLVFIVVITVLLMFMVLFCFVNVTTESAVNTTTSNTYDDISDATAEFRRLETDMEEFLNPETLEPLIQEENPDKEIYEFIYDLDEFGFSANTLIAYLSVKYQEFTLEEVAEEIQSVFDAMYHYYYELVLESRYIYVESLGRYEWQDVWICYVYLEKTEMETVVEARMTEEELEAYLNYKLATGGQQVWGGVMREDWTDRITSPFGERIHPITGERTFHNGVDIGIPTGTMLYAVTDGTVTEAQYSNTAGYYLVITTEDGWSAKYMHMDGMVVTAGQTIEKGDYVGPSGNTGRSTGPHLHLEIRNPDGDPIDPIFIVPQSVAGLTN